MLSKSWQKLQNLVIKLRSSLRVRVAFGVALPVLITMSSLSMVHYWREYRLIEEQARLSAVRLGDMMIHSLNHAMLFKNDDHLISMLEDVSKLENIEQIQIVGLSGRILAESSNRLAGSVIDISSPECLACHVFPPEMRPRIAEIESASPVLRISAPIDNIPECHACHEKNLAHLGVLLIDLSLIEEQNQLIRELKIDLLVSMLITVLISIGIYYLVHYLVVRRIEMLRQPLAEYAAGNLSVRVPKTSSVLDELSELGETFNHMADEIERYTQEQDTLSHVRERAIVEERERIARELHDGMAQILGYVNTKAMAVRIMLQKGQIQAADRQLGQLEEAARGLFVDVREAILGLKMAGEIGTSLTLAIHSYVEQFTRLCDLPVIVDIQPNVQELKLPADTELQLLRIIQEGLSNIRKHANASRVWLSLQVKDGLLDLQIRDDGQGFDIDLVPKNDRIDHYGLNSMQERASAIGASLVLDSRIGSGTKILVKLNLNGK